MRQSKPSLAIKILLGPSAPTALLGWPDTDKHAPVAQLTPPDRGRGAAISLASIAAHNTNLASKPPPQLDEARRPVFSIINRRPGAWGAQRLTRRPFPLVLRPAYGLTTASTKEKAVVFLALLYSNRPATNCCEKTACPPTKNKRAVTG